MSSPPRRREKPAWSWRLRLTTTAYCWDFGRESFPTPAPITSTRSRRRWSHSAPPRSCLARTARRPMERTLDLLADRLRLDPAEIRRRNLISRDAYPFTSAGGFVYDSGDLPKALEQALDLAGYDRLTRERDEAQAELERIKPPPPKFAAGCAGRS